MKRERIGKKTLHELLGYLNLNANRLSVEIGLKNNSIFYHIATGRNNFSEELAYKITKCFPEIDPLYLIKGKGELVLEKPTPIHFLKETLHPYHSLLEAGENIYLLELVKKQKQAVEEIDSKIRFMLIRLNGKKPA